MFKGDLSWRIRAAIRSLFSPANIASNVVWYLIELAVPLVISLLVGTILKLSVPEKIILGVAVFLLLVAIAIAWRERHMRRPFSGEPVLPTPGLSFPHTPSGPAAQIPPPQGATAVSAAGSTGSLIKHNTFLGVDTGVHAPGSKDLTVDNNLVVGREPAAQEPPSEPGSDKEEV